MLAKCGLQLTSGNKSIVDLITDKVTIYHTLINK